jgi:hypothetical protein
MPHDLEDASVFTLEYPDAEVVIGIVCAVGADYTKISEFLVRTLPALGYRANVLKVSSFITLRARPRHCTKTRFVLKMPWPEDPAGEQEIPECPLNRSSGWGLCGSLISFRSC